MDAFESGEVEAWHEAGHAVVAWLLGGRVQSVTLDADEDAFGGRSEIAWRPATAVEAASLSARVALAGPIAEVERFGGEDLVDPHVLSAWAADWAEVERCADVVAQAGTGRLEAVSAWVAEVRQLVAAPDVSRRIARVADALDAHRSLDETLFEDCM